MDPEVGYEAETADVDAFTADVADIPDAAERYARASAASIFHQAIVERLGAIRRQAVAQMHAEGASYAAIARVTGLSRARIQQLVEQSRTDTDGIPQA